MKLALTKQRSQEFSPSDGQLSPLGTRKVVTSPREFKVDRDAQAFSL